MLEIGKVIGEGYCNRVYEAFLGDGESYVAKLAVEEDANLPWEWEAIQAINKINDVMPKGIALLEYQEREYLVIERLCPISPSAIQVDTRVSMLKEFLQKLKELHSSGWAHGDIKRPFWVPEDEKWDNIILTKEGIKLIDAGAASIGDKEQIQKDVEDVEEFSTWFLNQ